MVAAGLVRGAGVGLTAFVYNGMEEILHNAAPRAGALRAGDWKLVINGQQGTTEPDPAARGAARNAASPVGQPGGDRVELFNIAKDPSEKHDLSRTMPEKVSELRTRYEAYARQAVPPKAAPRAKDFQTPKVWGEK